MGIKKGTLVKAWYDDPSEYVIGSVVCVSSKFVHIFMGGHGFAKKNAIPLPPELAKQLEELE